mgnify:CR=1 FL=1
MKKLLFLFSAFLSISLSANHFVDNKFGSDSIQCIRNINLLSDYVKQKNYSYVSSAQAKVELDDECT